MTFNFLVDDLILHFFDLEFDSGSQSWQQISPTGDDDVQEVLTVIFVVDQQNLIKWKSVLFYVRV